MMTRHKTNGYTRKSPANIVTRTIPPNKALRAPNAQLRQFPQRNCYYHNQRIPWHLFQISAFRSEYRNNSLVDSRHNKKY